MIVGIGHDLMEIAKIKKELNQPGSGAKDEIFADCEIAYCEKKRYPERHLAARFAAKEALFKALGTGKIGPCRWKDIIITNGTNGQPIIELNGKTLEMAQTMSVNKIHLSLTHTSRWAAATVILESNIV